MGCDCGPPRVVCTALSSDLSSGRIAIPGLNWPGRAESGAVTLKKLECSKQAYSSEYISME